jgi:predicted component of type VI protein secretion system
MTAHQWAMFRSPPPQSPEVAGSTSTCRDDSLLTALLHDLGFEFSREHSKDGEHVLKFFQNLYERPGMRCRPEIRLSSC